MIVKLSDAEFIIMRMLWKNGNLRAAAIADLAIAEKAWEKNTTYTLINRLIKKNAITRHDPGFICEPLVEEAQIRKYELQGFLNKMYDGSLDLLVKSFVNDKSISEEELEKLRKIINQK